jgi:hypothetical protein
MTMDDPGWGGYVPPSETPPPPPPPPEHSAAGAVAVGQQQVAKAGAWLSDPKNRKLAIGGAVVLLIIIIGAAVGLGGSSGLSKSAYISKADAICSSFAAQNTAAADAGNKAEVISLGKSELAQLKAIGLPNQDPQPVTDWLNNEQSGLTALEQGNEPSFDDHVTKAAAIASSYGLVSCAS